MAAMAARTRKQAASSRNTQDMCPASRVYTRDFTPEPSRVE